MATDHFGGACVNMPAFGHGLAGSSFGAMSSSAQLEAEARAGTVVQQSVEFAGHALQAELLRSLDGSYGMRTAASQWLGRLA